MFEISGRKPVTYYPKFEPLQETVSRVIENITKRKGIPEFKTGLEVLDRGIFGLNRSHLTILAARPGQGKTAMGLQVAYELADAGKKTAIISLELTRETVIERMFCQTNQVNSREIQKGILSEETKVKLISFRDIISHMPLRIIDDYCFTEIEFFTLMEHLEYRPDVIIFDHIQHIRMSEGRLSERETLNNYLRYLKEIAMKFKIAVLCLSQINRLGEDKPTLANLKGTGSIEELADEVILLHLENKREDFDSSQNFTMIPAILDIAKNRFGPVGYFKLFFDAPRGQFVNQEFWQKESP